jgi:hypothetical protein
MCSRSQTAPIRAGKLGLRRTPDRLRNAPLMTISCQGWATEEIRMQMARNVPNTSLMEAMRRAYDEAVQVLQPANAWERDRLASKIVALVQRGELDAQRLCRAALSEMHDTAASG